MALYVFSVSLGLWGVWNRRAPESVGPPSALVGGVGGVLVIGRRGETAE